MATSQNANEAVLEAHVRQERTDAAFTLALQLLQLPGKRALSLASAEMVLKSVLQAQQHSRAVELLRAACSAGVVPGDAAFNGALDVTVRARAYTEAWDIFELLLVQHRRADKYFVSILTKSLESATDRRWVRRGINLVDQFINQQRGDVDEIVFNSLLNVLGHISDMPRLQTTLSKMSEYGVLPSAVTYGTVVKAYGRSRDIDAVLKVWQEMRQRCLGVNPVTCGCVLDACVKCGYLEKAMAIFQEMRSQGLHKNTVLYATLIKGLSKVRNLTAAVQLYQEMRMDGVPCNLVTFNSLMDVCVRCGDLQTAALFLQDMMRMGIDPDLITFSTLIKGYSQTGDVNKALALSSELIARGLKCDEIMYNSLIDGCAKANRLQDGLRVFDDMLQSRVMPSNITFSILVKLYFEAGLGMDAINLVEDMSSKYRCTPSRIVYTVLFRCCAQVGGDVMVRGVSLLSELFNKRGTKLVDHAMVSAMTMGCLRHGDLTSAATLVRDFAASGSRRSCSMMPSDCMRAVAEALGAADDCRGNDLLEYLRKKALPGQQLNQFQTALADGRQRGAVSGLTSNLVELRSDGVSSHQQTQASLIWRDPASSNSVGPLGYLPGNTCDLSFWSQPQAAVAPAAASSAYGCQQGSSYGTRGFFSQFCQQGGCSSGLDAGFSQQSMQSGYNSGYGLVPPYMCASDLYAAAVESEAAVLAAAAAATSNAAGATSSAGTSTSILPGCIPSSALGAWATTPALQGLTLSAQMFATSPTLATAATAPAQSAMALGFSSPAFSSSPPAQDTQASSAQTSVSALLGLAAAPRPAPSDQAIIAASQPKKASAIDKENAMPRSQRHTAQANRNGGNSDKPRGGSNARAWKGKQRGPKHPVFSDAISSPNPQ